MSCHCHKLYIFRKMTTMKFFRLCVLAGAVHQHVQVHAAPMDWEGSFTDSIYGGQTRVCVDQSSSTSKYYAQALFSDLGYMRGEVSASDVWTGAYYMAGEEARRGTFSLALTVGTPSSSFTGTFTENSGATYSVAETKVDSSVPENIDCFRTDLDLVTNADTFSFTGEWIDGIRVLFTDVDTDTVYGSYNYGPENAPGYHIGPVYANGQVVPSNWLEVGTWNGLYLFVAKNKTSFYSFWWDFPRVSDFDYSKRGVSGYFGHRENKYDTASAAHTTISDGNKNSCYSLNTVNEETACLAGDYDGSDDNDTDLSENLLIAVLVMMVVVTIAVMFMCVSGIIKSYSSSTGPLAGKDSSSKL